MSSRHDRAQRLRREEELYSNHATSYAEPASLTEQGLRRIFTEAARTAELKRDYVENSAVLSLFAGRRYSREERYAQKAVDLLREKKLAQAFLAGAIPPLAQRQENAPVRIRCLPDEAQQRDLVRCSLAHVDRDLDTLAFKGLTRLSGGFPYVSVDVPEQPVRSIVRLDDRDYARVLSGHRVLNKNDAFDPHPPIGPMGM